MSALGVAVDSGRGWVGAWAPGIGDPSVFGWLVTLAYFAASLLCLRAAFAARAAGGLGGSAWAALSLALSFLGINKQIDLQTLLTEIARILAVRGGWYGKRRPVQLLFVAGVFLAGIWLLRHLMRLGRGERRGLRVALFGAMFLVCFIVVRAASFHHLDRVFMQTWSDLRLNAVVELAGIILVAVGAIRSTRSRRARPASAVDGRGM